jgi:hypothetical protein
LIVAPVVRASVPSGEKTTASAFSVLELRTIDTLLRPLNAARRQRLLRGATDGATDRV